MKNMVAVLLSMALGAGVPIQSAYAQSSGVSQETLQQLSSLNYLLAIDRIQYYAVQLSEHLVGQEKPELAEAIRKLTPEQFHQLGFSQEKLNDINVWNELVLEALHKNNARFASTTLKDIEWNYNFFRKKLLEGYRTEIDDRKLEVQANDKAPRREFTEQTVPQIKGKEILLDSESYISEKTTRALFWDAGMTGKGIEFHVGTERDFRQRVQTEGRQVVAEVRPKARNYNKIYLVLDPKTNAYSYAFTSITGGDRISHLMAQIRILKFGKKSKLAEQSVRIYGSVQQFHKELEAKMTDLFKTLPKADLIVIGQKTAIENMIATAGMMEQIQPDLSRVGTYENRQVENLAKTVIESGSYFSVLSKGSLVKSTYEKIEAPLVKNYAIANIEQPSHDMTDVLLEGRDGKIQRWRLISNMWGDEVVPVAKAIKNSGNTKVVYIGTAGAIDGKGLKVGDVASASVTYTQKGKQLPLENPTYGEDFVKTGKTLGQVRSPFDETDKWFREWSPKIDLVELETGYLKENLGKDVSFQPFLLVSDIVGSEGETLANAANSSGKRKNGQVRLLESLFLQNNIKAPIANARPMIASVEFQKLYAQIDELRPSRDSLSKAQLAQLALRQGLSTTEELEKLIKSEPAFDRQVLMTKLEMGSDVLKTLAQKDAKVNYVLVGPDELLNGTWNAKKPLVVQVMVGHMSAKHAAQYLKKDLDSLKDWMKNVIEIQFVDYDRDLASKGFAYDAKANRVLSSYYENYILKKAGLYKEFDRNGGVRFKNVNGFSGGLRCEAVML